MNDTGDQALNHRGRKRKTSALFWQIFEAQFEDKGESFLDSFTEGLPATRSVVYAWNAKGRIPYGWKSSVLKWMMLNDITLPNGVDHSKIFGKPRGKDVIKDQSYGGFNSALYQHVQKLIEAHNWNLKSLHDHLAHSASLLNLALLMRWVFESGGITPTRVRAYISAVMKSPLAADLVAEYGIKKVDEGVEYAYRAGWVAGEQISIEEDFQDYLARRAAEDRLKAEEKEEEARTVRKPKKKKISDP